LCTERAENMKNVLFVASLSERYYYDPFLVACRDRVNVYIFDPLVLPNEGSISLHLDATGYATGFVDVYKIKEGGIEQVRLAIPDIHTAWYLRESDATKDSKESSLESRFSQNESRGAVRSFLSVLDCSWVNKKETIDFLASNKLYQQKIAQKSGLLIPPTLITNHPEDAALFSHKHGGLLLKTIGYITFDEDGRYFLYSQRFGHSEITKGDLAIKKCPIFAQEYVEKLYEYRVMVIGDQILACRIDSQASESTRTDWRHYDFDRVAHLQVGLPTKVQEKLLLFMKSVGLRYGAIDLIETPTNEFVFLEVNPSGQWGWISDIAGVPVAEAVANMLETL